MGRAHSSQSNGCEDTRKSGQGAPLTENLIANRGIMHPRYKREAVDPRRPTPVSGLQCHDAQEYHKSTQPQQQSPHPYHNNNSYDGSNIITPNDDLMEYLTIKHCLHSQQQRPCYPDPFVTTIADVASLSLPMRISRNFRLTTITTIRTGNNNNIDNGDISFIFPNADYKEHQTDK